MAERPRVHRRGRAVGVLPRRARRGTPAHGGLLTACAAYQDRTLRDLPATRIECDEIWAFCYAKARNVPEEHRDEFGYGDVWTWVALDPDTKLVPSWLVGQRDGADAMAFIADLALAPRATASRSRRTATSPTSRPSRRRSGGTWTTRCSSRTTGRTRTRSAASARQWCCRRKSRIIRATPDPDRISTSYRRAPEPDHADGDAAVHAPDQRVLQEGREPRRDGQPALHVLQLRARPQVARQAVPATPAMAAGVADHVWTCEEIAALMATE